MATRIVEGKKPYTGGQAIEIDENKVISLRLRDENNLIIYDSGDDEIYVDLQLPDEITPTDAFPVGVTTGRVVVDNGWDKAGTIICAKTTSGDVIKLVYADEGTLWIDNGTGTFKQIYFKGDVDTIVQAIYTYIDDNANTKTFFISGTAEEKKAKLGQAIQYYLNGKNPILRLGNTTYTLRDVVVGEFEQGTNDVYKFSSTIKSEDGKFWEIVVDVPVSAQGHGSTVSSFTDTKHSAGAVVSATAPSNPAQGDLWYDTTNSAMKVWNGTAWQSVGTGGGGSDIVYATQAEYNALLPGAESDNKHYFIYSESGGGGWQPGANTVLYCPLKDDILDHSGNHTMTMTTSTYGTVAKDSTGFYYFNGGYISSEAYSGPTTAGTLSTWVKKSSSKSGGDSRFTWASSTHYSDSYPYHCGLAFSYGGYGGQNGEFHAGATSGTSGKSISGPTMGSWELWTMTYDNTVGAKFYRNGVYEDSFSNTNNLINDSLPTFIGATNPYTDQYLDGYLSDVIIEDKARTAQEITDYYNLTKGNYGIS